MSSDYKANKRITTLCILHDEQRVLLAMKKRGFGAGRWNGYGGKVLPAESIEESAIREVLEESGMQVEELQSAGVLTFDMPDEQLFIEAHLFRIKKYSGDPSESEEMKPNWFDHSLVPYEKMWADDNIWLPHFLKGKNVKAHFTFKGDTEIIDHKLELF